MKQIHYMELINEKDVAAEEKNRKTEYKKQLREINALKEKEANDKKKTELADRMGRVFQKVGRQTMPRSQKKVVKREVRVVKVDQETLDRQRYLGELVAQGSVPNGGTQSILGGTGTIGASGQTGQGSTGH